jgi:sulfatase maturation enzyme AslB (radical SAM superfamily)
MHITRLPNAHTHKRVYDLLFVQQQVSIAVAIIIRVTYKNIRNPNKFVKTYKWTTQILQRLSQTFYTVTKRQFCLPLKPNGSQILKKPHKAHNKLGILLCAVYEHSLYAAKNSVL